MLILFNRMGISACTAANYSLFRASGDFDGHKVLHLIA
jgi:hypothetical protein